MSRIQQSLEHLFTQHRIVFWYDEGAQLQDEFNALELSKIHKLTIENNEFSIKLEVIQKHPKTKYLIYSPQGKPEDNDNWLLDLCISNTEFHADQASLFLQELGLSQSLRPFIKSHEAFFKAKARIAKLKELIKEGDNESQLANKMMAVLCKLDSDNLDTLLFSILEDEANEDRSRFAEIEKFKLSSALWSELEGRFGYRPDAPSVYDFSIELFNAVFYQFTNAGTSKLNRECLVFVNRWQDSVRYQDTFRTLSNRIAEDMRVEDQTLGLDLKNLKGLDLYKSVDKTILSHLKQSLISETILLEDVEELIQIRSEKFWYSETEHLYQAVLYAARVLNHIKKLDFKVENFEQGISNYTSNWYKVDYCYRKFVLHWHESGSNTFLADLQERVEGHYTNHYLMNLGDAWQSVVDENETWGGQESLSFQSRFYSRDVKPFVDKKRKIFVIISDALRYETAVELNEQIQRQPKFDSKLKASLGALPSVTSVGMASLLPHKKVELNDKLQARVQGKATQGTPDRSKILAQADAEVRATAIKADAFLKMNTNTEGRELAKNHDVIYIYSNEIDATGDKRETEGRVFEASQDEIDRILKMLKKIANVNGTYALITADHGYLYQESEVAESDFAEIPAQKDELQRNRRFVIGHSLDQLTSAKSFTSRQLDLEGDLEFLFPKSARRLRVKGAGSRFVHGGTSLQEVVVPVIHFNRVRDGEIEQVGVDVITSNSRITANQLTVRFYQDSPVSESVQAIELKVGFQSSDGTSISNIENLVFESTEENSNNRERMISFTFAKDANQYNNQEVFLVMESKIPGTSQHAEYMRRPYKMMITFNDFDEF
jgi:uncharacterized protein (TIGR02687 family)